MTLNSGTPIEGKPSAQHPAPIAAITRAPGTGLLDRLFKTAVVILTLFILLAILFGIGRSAIYKIHAYERGLHLRGGRFISVDNPGWHIQIPLVDTVIIVKVNERLGYIERIAAMTSDDVTMDVSLQYTYRVLDPKRFALEVDNPERIVFEFVQGKLRDVVNTKDMTEVMHSRAELNREVMETLREKEEQYGVEFITVQIQSASPPEEVVTAIKDRMVAVQRQEQAQAEAAQRRTLADAEYYTAQKEADGEAYQITKLAEADAQRISLTSAAQQEAVRAMLEELRGKGELAEQYIQLLIAQELKENSKWIISGTDTAPVIELRDTP
ncbi:MAG: SPFH domain-containing protein [Anaerolineae bacterium]|nr:SPFH domain-containing protein [Anaerolineae bacterium]